MYERNSKFYSIRNKRVNNSSNRITKPENIFLYSSITIIGLSLILSIYSLIKPPNIKTELPETESEPEVIYEYTNPKDLEGILKGLNKINEYKF